MPLSVHLSIALLFLSSATATAGDIKIVGVGQVISIDPAPLTGALAGVVVGSSFEMTVEVFDTPTIVGPGDRTYPIDAASGSLIVGPASFSYDTPTAELGITNNALAGDQLSVPADLDTPGNLWAILLLADGTGLTLPTDDLAQLVGMTFLQGPAALLAGITSSTGASTPTVVIQLTEIRIENGGTGSGGGSGPYCMAAANSTGSTGSLVASGSFVAADNDVTLTASGLPANAFGFFITSQTQGFVTGPAGSAGNLCLGGSVGRYVGPGQISSSGAAGQFSLALDLLQTPTPNGFVSIAAGQTWSFQAWYRDSASGTPTSNFTQGYRVDFL